LQPWHNTTYPDLFVALWECVHDSTQPGPKIEIHASKSICRVDPTNSTLYFSDGSNVQGDLVIGADGVHSVCRSFVPGGNSQRFRIKRHVFRAIVPREKLQGDARLRKFVENPGQAYCYNHHDRSLLVCPASDDQVVCIKYLYEEHMAFKNLSKDWRDPSSKRKLLRLAQGLPEECIALFQSVSDKDLQDQPVWDMDPLVTFQCHRMALMGDAAHPMPPYCGQRIAMALEDALALGVILEPGVAVGEIEERLKLYSRTRKGRAVAVQQTMRGLSEADMRNLASDFDTASFHTYILGHNERQHMEQTLTAWKQQRAIPVYNSPSSADPEEQSPGRHSQVPASPSRQGTPSLDKKWWTLNRRGSRPWTKVFSSRDASPVCT